MLLFYFQYPSPSNFKGYVSCNSISAKRFVCPQPFQIRGSLPKLMNTVSKKIRESPTSFPHLNEMI